MGIRGNATAVRTVVRTTSQTDQVSDICLILEGSYRFVFGGVSSWTQGLMESCGSLSFSAVSIRPAGARPRWRYDPPYNFTGLVDISLVVGRGGI